MWYIKYLDISLLFGALPKLFFYYVSLVSQKKLFYKVIKIKINIRKTIYNDGFNIHNYELLLKYFFSLSKCCNIRGRLELAK